MAEEIRTFTVIAERSAMGRSSIDIRCPFCGSVVTAYVWSLAGSGKRCTHCRALFTGRGQARGEADPVSPISGSSDE